MKPQEQFALGQRVLYVGKAAPMDANGGRVPLVSFIDDVFPDGDRFGIDTPSGHTVARKADLILYPVTKVTLFEVPE